MASEPKLIWENIALGFGAILDRLDDAQSDYVVESVEELERYHDRLAHEVRNIVGMLSTIAKAKARGEQTQPLKNGEGE